MKNRLFSCLFYFIICLTIKPFSTSAQVVVNESFDAITGGVSTNIPFGWYGGKLTGSDVNNYVERVTTGTLPACAPHSGAGMIRYRSGSMFNAGEKTYLSIPRLDLTNNPGTATVSFWIYRDNFNTIKDSITLYINDSSSANLSYGSMSLVGGPVTRAGGANAWVQFTYTIPAGYNNSSAYLILVFTNRETTGSGGNIYINDFSIQTYPKPMVLVSSALVFQNIADVNKGATDQLVVGIKVTCDGAGDPSAQTIFKIDSIVLNATGTSSLSDLVAGSEKLWYTKGTNSFVASGNQFGSGVSSTFYRDKIVPGATFYLENGDNYFWATLSTSASAISGNFIDIDLNSIYYRRPSYAGSDTSRAPIVSSLTGSRQIDFALCGGIVPTLIEGTSWINGSYTFNDYIQRVYLDGIHSVISSYPHIDNNINDVGPPIPPWFGGPAPFTVHPPDYQQFSQNSNSLHPNVTAVLVQGQSYTAPSLVAGNPVGAGIALQCGTWASSNYMSAWIDYNKDGDLIDAGEQLLPATGLSANSWVFGTVTVPSVVGSGTYNVINPSTLVYGNLKMRVREVFATSSMNPCQSGYTFGETEDYIVSVIPLCPSGVKLWLGYTDDWNSITNWCGGVPTISDVALIDEVGYLGITQMGAPYDPVIHPGTMATAKSIRLSGTDTLTINASSSASLQISDSLSISYNTPAGGGGLLKVNSSFNDTAQLLNANLQFLISPFQGNKKNGRMQLIYSKAELKAKGMIAGDYIDQFLFHFFKRATTSVASYNNFQIRYATVDSTWLGWAFGAPTSLAPATSAYVSLFGPAVVSLPMAMGSPGDYTINLTNRMYWNGESNLVVDICFDNSLLSLAGITGPDQLCLTTVAPISGYNETMWLFNTSITSGCGLGFPLPAGTLAAGSSYRPNITFHFNRPFTKFPINITGNAGNTAGTWFNNGNFIAGRSIVTFSNASQNQDIDGANSTTFCDLKINKTGSAGNNGLLLYKNANVDSTLILINGFLDLNTKLLTVNNPQTTSIQRTNSAYIKSENTPTTYGRLKKKIGSTTGTHLFPFGTTSGFYIPFSVNLTAGNMGYLTVSTYHTATDNTPWPNNGTMAGTVTHMQDLATHLDLSIQNVSDRFWQLDKSGGSSATANLTFTTTTSERPTLAGAADNTLKPQHWENPDANGFPGWRVLTGNSFTHVAANNSITINSISNDTLFSGPWVVSNIAAPLGELNPCGNVSPPTSVTPANPMNICSGTAINLNATSSSNSIYWFTAPTGGASIGNSASGTNFSYTPTVTTKYYAEARTNAGCTSSSRTATALITVDSMPGTSITASGPTTFCHGSSVNLTANGSGSLTWSNGYTTATISVNTSGTYKAVRIRPSGCTDSAQVVVTVKPLPSVSVTASKNSICKNDTTTLTASGGAFFTWAPSTGLSATTGSSVVAQPLVTTTYSVTGTSAFGCVKTVTKKITVNSLITLTITPTSANICPGASQAITVSGNGTSYSWLPTSGLNVTSGQSVVASPSSTTIYTVTASNGNGCTDTKTSNIVVKCPVSNNLTVSNITGTSISLSWTGPSCATGYKLQYRILGTTNWTTININSNNPNYSLAGLQLSTSYEWKVATRCSTNIYANFSGKSSFTTANAKLINEPVSVSNDALSVFPNPATELLNVEFTSETDGRAMLVIMNSIGQVVLNKEINITDGEFSDQLNINLYSTGLYLIRIEKETEIKTAKFLKE